MLKTIIKGVIVLLFGGGMWPAVCIVQPPPALKMLLYHIVAGLYGVLCSFCNVGYVLLELVL
jgi:hypothetical protein